jgi:glycosyltransferase involved in cell wall biosynthesis
VTAGDGISVLVPFRPDEEGRAATWAWLEHYWRWSLPGAELIVGTDDGKVFSKTWAVNSAAKQATGDVFVIMDADAYIDSRAITEAASACRAAKSWWMPYQGFWRMRKDVSDRLLSTKAEQPMQLELPPKPGDVQGGESAWDHAYAARGRGALCTVMPAEAFRTVGGMDPRFRGWGGEDTAFAAALDELWCRRSYADRYEAAHLWHSRIGEGTGASGRMWEGQTQPRSGRRLKNNYLRAVGNPRVMRSIVDEGLYG